MQQLGACMGGNPAEQDIFPRLWLTGLFHRLSVWLMSRCTPSKRLSFLRLCWLGREATRAVMSHNKGSLCNSVLHKRLREEYKHDKPVTYTF